MNQIVNQNLVSLTVPLAPNESAFGLTIPILTVPLQIDLNDGIGSVPLAMWALFRQGGRDEPG